MAQLIKEDSTIIDISPKEDKYFSLKELQTYVDGYIEVISLHDGRIMIINEEGKFSKEYNTEATAVACKSKAIYPTDYIAGDVVICKESEMK